MKNFLIILLFISLSFAGDNDRIGTTKPILLQSLPIDAQNATGFSNMISVSAGEISSANPAALANFSSLAAGLDFSLQTKIDYYLDIEISKAKAWLPSSFGLVYPLQNWRFGLAYQQKYTNYIDFGKITYSTVSNPDSGEVVNVWNESIIHSPSAIISYSFNGIFTENDRFVIGAQLFWNVWNECTVQFDEIRVNGSAFSWKAGFIYRVNERFGLGITYENSLDIEGKIEDDLQGVGHSDPAYYFKLPSKLSLGIELGTVERLQVAGTATVCFWNDLPDNYNNPLNLSFNVIYELAGPVQLSLGVYQLSRSHESEEYFSQNTGESAAFLSAGIKGSFSNFKVRLELLDSHLFSTEYQKYTMAKLGLDFGFGQ